MLLFCVGRGTDWQRAGVTGEIVTALGVRGLIGRDANGRLTLPDDGLAALHALLQGCDNFVAGTMCGCGRTVHEKRIIRRIDAGVSSENDPMSALHGERQLNTNQRSALELLAVAGERGCTGARLFNHGFTARVVADLVWSGLAAGHREIVRVGHRKIKIARIRITKAGRRALEGC